MGTIASQITSLAIVYSIVYSSADQRKYQSSASLAFVRGIHRGPVNSPHKWTVTREMFPFDDVIMCTIPGTHGFLTILKWAICFNSKQNPKISSWHLVMLSNVFAHLRVTLFERYFPQTYNQYLTIHISLLFAAFYDEWFCVGILVSTLVGKDTPKCRMLSFTAFKLLLNCDVRFWLGINGRYLTSTKDVCYCWKRVNSLRPSDAYI